MPMGCRGGLRHDTGGLPSPRAQNSHQSAIYRPILAPLIVQHGPADARDLSGFFLIAAMILANAWWAVALGLTLAGVFAVLGSAYP